MVGCCVLPCSVIRYPLCCPPLPSLTLSLPATAPSSVDLCHSLFDCPPSSVNGGYPSCHRFKPCIPLFPSFSLVQLSLIHPDWLLCCISSRHCLLSASASACRLAAASCHPPWLVVALPPPPFLAPPPPIRLGLNLSLFVPSISCHQLLLSPVVEIDWWIVFLSTLAVGKGKYP